MRRIKEGAAPADSGAASPGRKPPARNGYKYRPQYGLIVQCRDEADQRRVFDRLSKQGYSPKVVCV